MLLVLLALLQQPVAPPTPAKPAAPPKLIERVEVTPASAEVGVGPRVLGARELREVGAEDVLTHVEGRHA